MIQLIDSIEYAGREQFYILLQQKLLELLFEKYGVEGETKEATTKDKIRVAGSVFSELREYIPDMLGCLRGSKIRVELDAAAPSELAGFCALYTKFINKEVVVTLPEKWTLEETKCSIDRLTHEGLYKHFRTFDPNNAARIALNWKQKDVSGILGKVALEYHECMKKYTMGTGGGSGAPKNFAMWETWDVNYISLYMQQDANSYLLAVHIWNKLYGFPFFPRRVPMPDDCMVDDPLDFEYGKEEEDDCNSNPVLKTPGSDEARTTPTSSGKSQSKLARKEKGIESVLEKMSQGREEMNKAVKEIVGMMRSAGDTRSVSGLLGAEPHEIIDQINKSMTLIGTCQKELKDLCWQKQAITREGTNAELTQKQLKKMKIISKFIKGQRSMIATLENAIKDQCKKLVSVTKSTGDTDDDDNNSSSEEDDKSVSKSVNHDDNNDSSESE